MARLSIYDTSFLLVENDKTPMHVAGLSTLKAPEEQGEHFANKLYDTLMQCTDVVAPFNQRVKMSLNGLPKWQTVPVDLSRHVFLHGLPRPGDEQSLQALAARLHTPVMDLSRPLWEVHIIDGLSEDRIGLYLKFHHSLVDGAEYRRIVTQFFTENADDTDLVPFWQQPKPKRQRSSAKPSLLKSAVKPASNAVKQLGTVSSMTRLGSKMAMNLVTKNSKHLPLPFTAPKTPFNKETQQTRGFVGQSLSLARVKHTGRLMGATVNEVVLTVCDMAMNRYLVEQGQALSKPLTAMMPMKLTSGGSAPNSDIAMAMIPLGQGDLSPVERLAAVKSTSQALKDEVKSQSNNAYHQYSVLTAAVSTLGGKYKLTNPLPPIFNVLISNVPGPRTPLYLMGARVESVYPLSALASNIALNITLSSYMDRLDFGFIYCKDSLPGFDPISQYLEEAMVALEAGVMAAAAAEVSQQLENLPTAVAEDPDQQPSPQQKQGEAA